jgi:hypothetical protein
VGGATFGLAIEHVARHGAVVNIATQRDDETVTFRANRYDRACGLVVDGRLDGQVELEGSWREPVPAIDAPLHRRIGGKVVLHVD